MREALSPPFYGDNGGGKTSTPTPSSSVAASTATASTDSLNGLKFGKKIYFEDVGSGVPAKQGTLPVIEPFPAPASSSQGKKGKGSVQSNQPPRCQVDGCKVDLSGAKPYYSRHKVCALHSKSPKVMVAGREQRFCQQCSRFHEPSAFDQGKRSCRRRLAGHNERRRKPPLGSLLSRFGRLPLSLHGSDFIKENNRTGSLLMDFTHPRLPGRDIWPIIQVGDRTPIGEVTASAGRFLSHPWQDDLDAPSSESFSLTSHPYLQNSASGSVFSGSEISPACCFSRVSDSGCALSLLSPQPWMPRNRGSGLTVNNLLNDEGVPMAQSTNPSSTSSDKFLTMGSQWPSSFAGVIPEQFPAARSKASGNFRSYETSSSQQEIQREMGFRQLMPEPVNNQFPNDLELAQQGSRQSMEFAHLRGYGSSSQQMHWPL